MPTRASVSGPLVLTASLLLAGCAVARVDHAVEVPAASVSSDEVGELPALNDDVDALAAGVVVVTSEAEQRRVVVRIADDAIARRHGLMHVEHLPADVGMWFVWPEGTVRDASAAFWMRDVLIPLDIVFVGVDRRVVHIAEAVPCEERRASDCARYRPGADYAAVLEVAAGWMASHGFTVGDEAHLVETDEGADSG